MKLRDVAFQPVRLPLDVDLGKLGKLSSIDYLLVRVRSQDGDAGIGFTCSIRGGLGRITERVTTLAHGLIGPDVSDAGAAWDHLCAALPARAGVDAAAVSALDLALWDLRGHASGKPVHRLLGASRDTIPVYASHDMWESVPTDQLARRAEGFVREGYRALKIRTGGSTDPAVEGARMRAVREAVGPDVTVMYDAIQRYTADQAIPIGWELARWDLYWYEDSVPETDLAASARVAEAVDVPIACGEAVRFPEGYQRVMDHRAADILMVDMLNVGGITPWMRVARKAQALGLPVVSHMVPEVSAPVLAALPQGLILEWMPWSFGLFAEEPLVVDGVYHLPDRPGFGLTYAKGLDQWRVV